MMVSIPLLCGNERAKKEDLQIIDLTSIFNNPPDYDDSLEECIRLPPHMRCAAHRMNLIATKDAEAALQNKDYKNVSRKAFAKANALWNKQGQSEIARDLLRDNVDCLLIRPNDTRWNATFKATKNLFDVIKTHRTGLNRVTDELGLPRFQDNDISFYNEYNIVMSPFCKALDILQGEKNKATYISCLLPTLTSLKQKISTAEQIS